MTLNAEDIDRRVGAKLRFIRGTKGLTQTDLAKAVGVTFQQIQKYEQGSNRISASKLWMFCEALNVSPNTFFDGLDDKLLQQDTQVSRKVAETALHLHQIKNSEVKRNMLELIRLCQTTETRAAG